MFGRLRIRGKLALVAALPLLAVALLTLPSVFNAVDRLQRAEEIERSMRVANRVTALVFELQQERLLSLGYLFEAVERGQLVTESARVDDRLVEIRHAVERGELGEHGLPEPVSAAVTEAEDLLVDRREPVLDRSVEAEQMFFEYSLVIGQLVDSLRLLDGADMATVAAQHVAVLEASLDMNEAVAQASALLLVVAATGSQLAGIQYAVVLQPIGDHFNQYIQYATREQQVLRDETEQAYIERDVTGEGVALGLDPYEVTAGQSVASMFPEIQSLGQLGRFVEGKIITDVLVEVESQRQSALQNAYLIGLGALLVVLVVVAATAVLARRVARPLLGLTDSANRVARVADAELARIADDESAILMPEPIRIDPVHVEARDEIGDLGRAFERVQAIAIRLVERQMISRRNVALMFGYLGRRTQNLVGRQLDLIDNLERNETDANRLVDLYRLDHVSSRLRRNAGSLVVLSGASGPDEYTAPEHLADIVRLALGEIEDYERVDVDVPPAIVVAPAVVSDLVLMLAELMENATRFSPPHTKVMVSATAGYGIAGDHGAELSIVDHGIGMSEDRLTEENARLAHRERLDLAPTDVLGLFVVGRLARRHGMRVTLSETADGGVTAVVQLHRGHLLPGEISGKTRSSLADGEQGLETSAPAGEADPSAEADRAGEAPQSGDSGQPDQPGSPIPLARRLAQMSGGAPEQGRFDLEALNRASRTLETGDSWNAFTVPPAAAPSPPAAPWPPKRPEPPDRAEPRESPERRDRPEPRDRPERPESPEPSAGQPGTAPVSTPPPSPPPSTAVPSPPPTSASAPAPAAPVVPAPAAPPVPPAAAPSPPPPTAASTGVPAAPGTPGPQGAPAPAGQPDQWPPVTPPGTTYRAASAGAPPTEAAGTASAASSSEVASADRLSPPSGDTGPSGLRRRVPGASLASSMPTRRTRQMPSSSVNGRPSQPSAASDPEQARDLVEQLQTGVMRALSEIQSQDGPAEQGIRGERDDQ